MPFDRKRPSDLATLKTEIDKPRYTQLRADGNMSGIADILNSIQDPPNRITVTSISREEAIRAVEASEWNALSDRQLQAWQMVMQLDDIPVDDPRIRNLILHTWEAGTTTRANLQALLQRDGTLAEGMFGDATRLGWEDVVAAINSGG